VTHAIASHPPTHGRSFNLVLGSAAALRQSSIPSKFRARAVMCALAFACVGAAAACGFDGRASSLETSAAPAETAPPVAPPTAPPAPGPSLAGDRDGGGDASQPIPTCTDPALAFDGVDDGASVPDDPALDLDDDFTVEAWIKPSAKATTAAEMDVVSHHDPVASRGWVLLVKSGRVEIVVYGGDIGGAQGYSAGNDGPAYVVPEKWAHIAGTRQGDTLRVYYDGVLRDTQDLGLTFGRDAYTGPLRLGRTAASADRFYEGQLDDVRLSTTARYTAGTSAKPVAALAMDVSTVAAWRFDEPSGSTLVDTAKHNHDGSLAADTTAPARVAAPCISAR
jgi:hypothetical protein